jgi:hypothetical protein
VTKARYRWTRRGPEAVHSLVEGEGMKEAVEEGDPREDVKTKELLQKHTLLSSDHPICFLLAGITSSH